MLSTMTGSDVTIVFSASKSGAMTAVPTSDSGPTSLSSSTDAGKDNGMMIGAGVGGVACTAVLILVIGYLLLRSRHRARQSKIIKAASVTDDVKPARDINIATDGNNKTSKENTDEVNNNFEAKKFARKEVMGSDDSDSVRPESSASSIRSEPLPSYAEAMNGETKS